MTFEAELDHAVHRVDSTLAIGFVTTAGGVLENARLISEQDIHTFRNTVKTLSPDSSPIKVLFEENDRILAFLTKIYGANGLALNLLHHTWRPYLFSWIEILSEWGLELIHKGKMFFNSPIILVQGGTFKERRLCSQSLLDLAQLVLDFCGSIRNLEAILWLPCYIFDPSEDTACLDEELSTNLGFRGIDNSCFYKNTLDFKRRQVFLEFEHFLHCLDSFQSDRVHADSTLDFQQTTFLSENLRALLYQLETIKLASSSSFLFLELRRQRVISLLNQSSKTLRQLTQSFTTNISNAKMEEEFASDDLKARLCFEAMKLDMPSHVAEDIVDKFFGYCRHNLIFSKDIIAAESTKIHPLFNGSLLASFQRFTKELNLNNGYAQQKSKTLRGLAELEKAFQTMLESVKTLTIASLLIGCGVKTAPRSDVLESPPAIPFKELSVTPPQPANETKTDAAKSSVRGKDDDNAEQPKN